jgi:CheY-like chemotaxis protein
MKKLKILIAEDESLIRMGLKTMLTSLGHEVFPAMDGHEALNLFHSRSPDMAILDIRMPFTDGLEAAKAMYRHRPDPDPHRLRGAGPDRKRLRLADPRLPAQTG